MFYEKLDYVEGTEELLNGLVERKIPFTIVIASPGISIYFYFDYFKLGNWFQRLKLVYDDGSFPGNPESHSYKKAAKELGIDPSECIVIEDALTGIQSANRAGIGKVIAMIYSEKQREKIKKSGLKVDATYIEEFNDFLSNYYD